MKIVLTALNASYIHTPLGIWYIQRSIKKRLGIECIVIDKTINDDMDNVLSDIMAASPQMVCFSVYIWNVEKVRWLIYSIKHIDKDIKVVLGGPEVSFDISEQDDLFLYSDHIIRGEGESAICEYIESGIFTDKYCEEEHLKELPLEYDKKILERCKNKLIYFESSRGCPYKCSYCLSSGLKHVRYFDMDNVKSELYNIVSSTNNQTIKFVDRTFNADLKRAKDIIRFLIEHGANNKFHFEIMPDLLDDEIIDMLNRTKKGMFMLEAGLQSTNETVLAKINRKTSLSKTEVNIKRLVDGSRVHIHLDLIIGLPFEDIDSIKQSFNDAYDMRPHELQVGFLKFLKGTQLIKEADKYGYVYSKYPPYELILSKWLSFSEKASLKKLEAVFERTYNSKLFITTLRKLYDHFEKDAYLMYKEMTDHFSKKGFFDRTLSYREIVVEIDRFAANNKLNVRDEIIFDHLSVNRGFSLGADYLPRINSKDKVKKALRENSELADRFNDMPMKDLLKKISFYPFEDGIKVFIHDQKDPLSGYFKSISI